MQRGEKEREKRGEEKERRKFECVCEDMMSATRREAGGDGRENHFFPFIMMIRFLPNVRKRRG